MSNRVKPIPEGYHTITPYLIVKGAEKAIEFYKKAFDAQLIFLLKSPQGGIGHAELIIGNSHFMLADEFPQMGAVSPQSIGGTPLSLLLYVENVDQFSEKAIDVGMKVIRPIQDQFYGDRSGLFEDPFGHRWSIASRIGDLTHDEIKKRAEKMFSQSGEWKEE